MQRLEHLDLRRPLPPKLVIQGAVFRRFPVSVEFVEGVTVHLQHGCAKLRQRFRISSLKPCGARFVFNDPTEHPIDGVLSGTMNFFTTHAFSRAKPREFPWSSVFVGRGHVRGQLLCRLPINFELRLQPRLCDGCQTLSELLPLFGL